MQQKISTLLMFDGRAEEAMNFYISTFPNSKLHEITRYGAGEHGAEGSVMHASFMLHGSAFMCIDSSIAHGFTFTPAISVFVTCDGEAEIDALYAALSANGRVYMSLDAYPFARKFGWIADRFGVSWQLSLP